MRAALQTVSALVSICLIGAPLTAAQAATQQLGRRWALTWSAGGGIGGPSAEIESAMIAGGLDDSSQCFWFCSGFIHYPLTYHGGLASMITVSYAPRPFLRIAAYRGAADLGETHGYKKPWTDLFLSHSVTSWGVVASVVRADLVALGVGPSLNFVKVTRVSAPTGPSAKATRPGFAFDARVTFPARSRFFVALIGQYRYVAPMDIGPFEVEPDLLSVGATMPRTRVSFSHAVVNLGLGVRL